ncbi:MAG: hypothetical protein GX575_10830 [Candidatus Anammoximicrobium sp.]|nr:hypothetical protein [Candidatus Anammoximicrobium sp.]
MTPETERATTAPVHLVELLGVLRPQVEKIEEGFKAIRVTLDSLAEHLGAAPAARSEKPATSAAVSKEPVPQDERRPVAEPKVEPPMAASMRVPPAEAAVPTQPSNAALPPNVVLPPMAQPMPAAAAPVPAAAPVAQAVPLTAPAQAARPGSIPVSGGSAGNWSQIIFGDQRKVDAGIGSLSGTLLSEVQAGVDDAVGMLGYLLAFRSADQERKPKLLKELGEAFYLWKPDGNPRLLSPLINWVHAVLDRAGINNRIDLVQVGDRYDMQRHNAKERGAEVAVVAGWVVLRDNGKVYSKANVSVR